VPAGKASDVVVHVPAGATVSWRFGVAEKDISFSVSAYRAAGAPAAAAAGGGASSPSASPSPSSSPSKAAAKAASIAPIPVARSTYGVHVNSPAFLSAGAAAQSNPFPVPAASVASSDDVPAGAAAGAAEETAVAATRTASVGVQSGSWTAPAAQPMLVRLRWDNSYSWMASKTVARRVDVSVAADGGGEGAAAAKAVRAPDADGDLATARADHRERITEWVAAGIKGPGGKK
jgi:trimeric autotransporter adhesin